MVLGSERAPLTSVFGSAALTRIRSTFAAGVTTSVPISLPSAIGSRIDFSTCRFQPQSVSPVSKTARAAEAASPPPLNSTVLEVRLVGLAVVLVDFVDDDISWAELGDVVRAGADRIEVELGVARGGAHRILENMAREDCSAVKGSCEDAEPAGVWLGERDADGHIIDRLDVGNRLERGDAGRVAAGSEAYSQVKTTSLAVNGSPSDQRTP